MLGNSPLRQLPPALRRYLAMPGFFFLGWLILSALLLAAGNWRFF
ncbi:MAG: hypothetical protein PHE55_12210 [Methylococcaceae bacterium]|nr:hypothetical protein [Methylococcaceae bacterium]